MSVEAMVWAANYQDLPLDGRTKKPSPACAAVLQCLAWHASTEGTDSFPSVARIVWFTKWSEHNVQLALHRLEEHGTIRRTPDPLRRAEVIPDCRHHPTSWDLVPMLRGANSDDPGHEGCKLDELRGANYPVDDHQEFAPERSYNLTQPKDEKPKDEKDQQPSSSATPDGVPDQKSNEDRDLLGQPACSSQARSSRSKPKPRQDRNTGRPDVDQLCDRLRQWIIQNGSKPPTITKAWRDAARLMIDADGRELDKALRLIDWCQANEFWRSNILSMPTFRHKFDKLRLKANEEWEQTRNDRRPGGDTHNGNGYHKYFEQLSDDDYAVPAGYRGSNR